MMATSSRDDPTSGSAAGRQTRNAIRLPQATAVATGAPPLPGRAIQRRPSAVDAQKSPASSASALPSAGRGALAVCAGVSTKKRDRKSVVEGTQVEQVGVCATPEGE